MNKPSNILPDVSVEPLEAVAHAILAGDFSSLPALEFPTYSTDDYSKAAQAAVDCGDFSELRWMIDHEAENDREERSERFRDMLSEGRRPASLSSGWLVGGA